MNQILNAEINLLPDKPGCYMMYNSENEIIYIGKAKNLKKRVSQYFLRSQNGKTAAMVSHVDYFKTIITKSEKEAFILEMNLIQDHHPRYNIMLMDDKHYPYIAVHKGVKDPFVSIARNTKDKKCDYYGPFPNSSAAYEIIELINKLYPLRKCKSVPKSPCLYYHLGQCLAPCIKKVEKEQYETILAEIRNFLRGNNKETLDKIRQKMEEESNKLNFEKAQEYKKMYDYINHINEKQTVEFQDNLNRDIYAFYSRDGYVSIVIFIYRKGILLSKKVFCYEIIGEINEFVAEIISQYYLLNPIPNEIVVSNEEVSELLSQSIDANVVFATKGKLHDTILTIELNAKEELESHFQTARLEDDKLELLEELGKILNIKTPLRIELFDNSHLQGTNAIGAMVVYINGEPVKKMYRKFNIEGYNKKDDLASTAETLTRRYSRLKKDNDSFPDLVIVDGGETQIEVALKVMEDLEINIPIAGLVKNDKHQTSQLMNSSYETYDLSQNKKLFFMLTRMQDEVHRYAITTHIKKRSNSMFKSVFDDVDGLGPKRKEALCKLYPSINELKNAKIEELMQVLPKNTAENLYKKLKEMDL